MVDSPANLGLRRLLPSLLPQKPKAACGGTLRFLAFAAVRAKSAASPRAGGIPPPTSQPYPRPYPRPYPPTCPPNLPARRRAGGVSAPRREAAGSQPQPHNPTHDPTRPHARPTPQIWGRARFGAGQILGGRPCRSCSARAAGPIQNCSSLQPTGRERSGRPMARPSIQRLHSRPVDRDHFEVIKGATRYCWPWRARGE